MPCCRKRDTQMRVALITSIALLTMAAQALATIARQEVPAESLAPPAAPKPDGGTAAVVEELPRSKKQEPEFEVSAAPRVILETIPSRVDRTQLRRASEIDDAAEALDDAPAGVIARGLQRWTPGQVVRVAFSGGSDILRADIERLATLWTAPEGANIFLSFRDASGTFRTWSSGDRTYAAEIRISFLGSQYQSLIGADSIDYRINGGGPGEASLWLGGFDTRLPAEWEATVVHEFGHALGFMHEHQSPEAACGWRLEDDRGYRRTVDIEGWYTRDRQSRWPGAYTYLGGFANHWKRSKVNANLLELPDSAAFDRTVFDASSIMKYAMPAFLFEAGEQSPCFLARNGTTPSPLDLAAARAAYPQTAPAVTAFRTSQAELLDRLAVTRGVDSRLRESASRRLEVLRATPP